jgi:SAM-dependent methyltransferase
VGDLRESYAPGWAEDALAMMSRRTAESRAGFFLPFLETGMRILDVGCGPGTITLGLANAVAPGGTCVGVDLASSQVELARAAATGGGVGNVAFEVSSAYALPFPDRSFDAAFSHALFEHLARPADALAELRRVLRPGGVAGICSSDWEGAVIEPRTDDVDAALECHFRLRRRAGGDPFAGGRLPALVEAAGFVEVRASTRHEIDMPYRDFARYVGTRIAAAAAEAAEPERSELLPGVEAARRWEEQAGGVITQPWTAVTAQNGRNASSPSRR